MSAAPDDRQPRRQSAAQGVATGTGAGDGGTMETNERLDRVEAAVSRLEGRVQGLESAVEGLRQSQGHLMASVAIVAAFVIGFGVYQLQRLDQLGDKINEVPSKISADMRDLTKTLAASITAAKQQPVQVIMVPAPQQQPVQRPRR